MADGVEGQEPGPPPGRRASWGSAQDAPSLKAGLAQAVGEQFSFEKSVGGVRGILESVVPITVFSTWYGITHELVASCVAALVPSVVFAVWRLVRRETLMQAISGVLGVALGAFLAVRTGRAENFFLPSIIKNIGWGAAYAVSALVRWPLIGLILGVVLGEQLHWRKVPARLRAYTLATWLWAGLFGVRLLVEIPLYLAGQTTALGIAAVPLGIPLFALTIWLTWIVIRRVPVAHPPHGEHEGSGHHVVREPDAEPLPEPALETREP